MAISRITSKDVLEIQYKFTSGGSKILLTRKAPGVVSLTTPGEYQVVVGHVSYYLDAVMQIFADGSRKVERWHLVYRYGNQGDPVSSSELSAVEGVAGRALDALEAYADEVGCVALSDADADDHEKAAVLTRDLNQVQAQIFARRSKAERIAQELGILEGRESALERELTQVRERIENRGKKARSLTGACAVSVDITCSAQAGKA